MTIDTSSNSILQNQLMPKLLSTFGTELSRSDLDYCCQEIQIIKPKLGKQFWSSLQSKPGILIIVFGKVRLLDLHDNFLISLESGETFGELTLSPEADFQSYTARASLQLKLAFLCEELIQTLRERNPNLDSYLRQRALQLDLLLLCRQIPQLQKTSIEGLRKIVSLLEPHALSTDSSINSLADESILWLLRKGELADVSGQRFKAASLYIPEADNKYNSWRVQQPTELYILDREHAQIARTYLPELTQTNTSVSSLARIETVPAAQATKTTVLPPEPNLSKASKQKRQPYFPKPTQQVGHFWQRLIRRYPFYAQQSRSDCGAACLVMVGRYWGKQFSLNRLRDLARVSRSGSSLKGLVRAAETIGFNTRPVRATLKRLAQQPLPAIAHWEGNHYIVVYEIKGNRVIIGDPAVGLRTLTKREFQAGWTNYALLLEPTVWLRDAPEAKTSLWQFWDLLKPHRIVISEIFVASVLIQVFGLVTPLLTQLLLDRVVVQQSSIGLMAVGLGLLIFGLFKVIMSGLRQYLLDHTAKRIDLALIVGFIRHTLSLPLNFFESRYVGDIIARVQENRKIQRFLTGEALSIVLDLLTAFVYIGLMFWYSWKMALIVLTIVPPFVLLALVATPFLQRISREIFSALAKESSYLIEALTGIATIKSMAVEQRVRWQWEELLNNSIRTSFSGQIIGNKLRIFSSTIQVVITTSILWFGAWQVIQNELSIGQLVAFNMLLGNVISPFQRLTVLWHELQEVIISVERINDVLDAEPEEDLNHKPRQMVNSLRGHLCFQEVTFRYHPDSETNVLENLSFEVQPGQTVALVGRSGSGKTTIAKLILGLYAPSKGQVLIDDFDLTTVSLRSFREHIGVVDQSNFLFGSTIRENICISHPQASLAEIREAAIQAGADEFIQRFPLGYETPIGERGGMLSGGQRQRLAIARALLGHPSLLILDEATSNLDAESERIIQNNLNTILKGRTTIVIAHRLSTIRNADLILVLDRGILVERGTHAELMAKRGHYFYLNQQQLAINT